MTFVDIPAIPPPPRVKALLARIGLVSLDQADDVLGRAPEAYAIRETADANREWCEILASEERDLAAQVHARFLGLPPAAIVRGVLRCMNARCVNGYRFFRMAQRLFPARYRYAVAAPRRLRAGFAVHGVSVNQPLSAALWFLCRIALLLHAGLGLARSFVAALRDGLSAAGISAKHPIVWLGLTPVEISSQAGELNAVDFVREGPLALFREAAAVCVAAPWESHVRHIPDTNVFVCPDPMRATSASPLLLRDLVGLLRDSLAVAGRVLLDAFRHDGAFLLLARDYVHLPRMRLWFEKVRPKAVALTNSMYALHPLWLAYASAYHCDAVVLFYATNILPLYLRGERDPVADPGFQLLDCTRLEVWTEGQKQWLVSLGIPPQRVSVAGVIIWGKYDAFRRPRPSDHRPSADRVRIGIFDVVPVKRTFFNRLGLGDNYYSLERMSRLLLDVVEVSGEVIGERCEILLKSKRGRLAIHEEPYLDLVDRLDRQGLLSVYSAAHSPIDAVASCDLVVSAPFSSPSVIASQLGIPSCFYDPADMLRDHPIPVSPEVPLIGGRERLMQWIVAHVACGPEPGDRQTRRIDPVTTAHGGTA